MFHHVSTVIPKVSTGEKSAGRTTVHGFGEVIHFSAGTNTTTEDIYYYYHQRMAAAENESGGKE